MPPTDAERMKPRIALRFSSGRASINDALNTVFPAQLKRPARKPKMQRKTNCFEKQAAIKQGTDSEKPRLITQKRSRVVNFIAPSNNEPSAYAAE